MSDDAILTDEKGVPIPAPRREDYGSDADYARAYHTFRDRVTAAAARGFCEGLAVGFVSKSPPGGSALTRVNARIHLTEFQLQVLGRVAAGISPYKHVEGRRRGAVARALERLRCAGYLRFRGRTTAYATTPLGREVVARSR